MKNKNTLINSLVDRAIWECVWSPDSRSMKPRSSKAGKPGEYILKLPFEQRELLKDLTSKDLQHRLPEVLKDMLKPIPLSHQYKPLKK